MRSNYHNN